MSLTSSLLVVAFKCYEREVALGNPKFCYFVLLGLLSDLEQLVFALDSSWRVVVSLRQSSSVLGTDSSLAHLLDDCKGVSRALILTCQCTYNSDTRGLQPSTMRFSHSGSYCHFLQKPQLHCIMYRLLQIFLIPVQNLYLFAFSFFS